jgi:hypothetical protein
MNDDYLFKTHPNALKKIKINNVAGYVYDEPGVMIIVMYVWNGWHYAPNTRERVYDVDCYDVWRCSDYSKTLIIPSGVMSSHSVNMMNALGMPVCGKFRRKNGKVEYEFPGGPTYEIPLDTAIQFTGSVPLGATIVPLVKKRVRHEKTSEW